MATKESNWKTWATIGFLLLLALNVVLCAAAVGMALRGEHPLTIFPEDSPPALRLLLFLVGLGAAWICGRLMLETLVRGEVEVASAVTAGWSVVFYVALFFVVLAFVGAIHWAILLVLLVLALFYTVPAFWKLVGGKRTGLILMLCLVLGGVAVFLTARD
jgi:hypothetical protein